MSALSDCPYPLCFPFADYIHAFSKLIVIMSQYTQLLSGYLLDAFQHKLQTRSGVKLNIPPTLPSPTLSTELVAECEHISVALVDAFLNPGLPTHPFLHLFPPIT